MSERLNLLDLDKLAKNANKRETTESSKEALSSLKEQIQLLKTSHTIDDKIEGRNATQILRNIMVEILTSDEGLTIRQGDQLSYINGLLPKGYNIKFNKEADFVKIGEKVRVVIDNGTFNLISSGSNKVIGTLSQWSSIYKNEKTKLISEEDDTVDTKTDTRTIEAKTDTKTETKIDTRTIEAKTDTKTSGLYSIDTEGNIKYNELGTIIKSSVMDIFSKIGRDQLKNGGIYPIEIEQINDIFNGKGIKMPKGQIYSLIGTKSELNSIKSNDLYSDGDLVIKEVNGNKVRYFVSNKTNTGWDSALIELK